MLESNIAFYCAPTLATIKPASIMSCSKLAMSDIGRQLEGFNTSFNGLGIYFEILCEYEKRVLIMVYRKKLLEKYIFEDKAQKLLREFGYPESKDTDGYLRFLKQRINTRREFPHEVGVFLGYPVHDIQGFIRNEKCLYSGRWKVYKNEEETKKLFMRYDSCTKAMVRRVEEGNSLTAIFHAAG